MKKVNKLKPKNAIILEDGKEKMVIVVNETDIHLYTDGIEYNEKYTGTVTFANEDGIRIGSAQFIYWEYIKEIVLC